MLKEAMMEQKKRGRPMTANDVKVTPEFKKDPDIEKLGRALIAVAMNLAEKKLAEEQAGSSSSGEGDTMT